MRSIAAFLALGLTLLAFSALSQDASFVEKAAQGGMAEVEASELAANRATSDAVRNFGTMLVEDHGAANVQLAEIAKSNGMPLPDTMGESHQEILKTLQAVEGPRFDQAYLAQMVKSHEESVQLLRSEIASGQNADLKAYATDVLPIVEKHLREAYRLTGRPASSAASPEPEGGSP